MEMGIRRKFYAPFLASGSHAGHHCAMDALVMIPRRAYNDDGAPCRSDMWVKMLLLKGNGKMKLKMSPKFENLTVPVSDDAENELAENLIREGCREPLTVWNGMIIDGHKRYRICTLEQIDFKVREIACKTEEEAAIWACRKRTAELPYNSMAYRYLMGKWYLCEVAANRLVKKPRAPSGGSCDGQQGSRTSVLMSREVGISHSTLEKYGSAAAALDVLCETEPGLIRAAMAGDIYLSQREILALSRLDANGRRDELRKIIRPAGRKASERHGERKTMKHGSRMPEVPLSLGIKDMPVFNPDMELQGLTLTIPTWITVMDRARKRSDLLQVTENAKGDLRTALMKLGKEIEAALEELS